MRRSSGGAGAVRSYDLMVRHRLGIVLLTAALAGCGSSGGEERARAPSVGDLAAGRRNIQMCVDRLLSRSAIGNEDEAEARRYAEDAYCARFARNGWVYDDGALSIAAYDWLLRSGTCAVGSAGEPTRTLRCEEAVPRQGPQILDCGLLHHVRKSEVGRYVEEQRRKRDVRCDDGTPPEELGVP
jgi:hypothetical protein